jgi:hypothetical protein
VLADAAASASRMMIATNRITLSGFITDCFSSAGPE